MVKLTLIYRQHTLAKQHTIRNQLFESKLQASARRVSDLEMEVVDLKARLKTAEERASEVEDEAAALWRSTKEERGTIAAET